MHGMDDVVLGPTIDRFQPEGFEGVANEQRCEEESGAERTCRQDEQRHQHDERRLMHMGQRLIGRPRLAMKRHEDQTPRVEGGQQRRRDGERKGIHVCGIVPGEGRLDNSVLGIVAGREGKPVSASVPITIINHVIGIIR